ncbi:ankyrin repeat domain-containing protein [Microbulbifer sp. 2201CG32-9]|uniref:ankyrin repeat domain-containing protein n=1 Tax=Microbulbifer sp. 2201CG32-9 TaxID=3232309 RepID=UPI00345B5652
MDDTAIDAFIASARKAAGDQNEDSLMNVMEPMLRRLANNQGVEFTATEVREIRGASRSNPKKYQVVSIVGNDITILVEDREFLASIDGNILVLGAKSSRQPLPYRKLNAEELAAFNGKMGDVERGPDPGTSPGHRILWAVNAEFEKAAEYIDKHPEVVALRDGQGNTMLHLAVSSRKAELVELLLEKGADVNALDNFNKTPLQVSLRNFGKSPQLLSMLIEAGAELGYHGNILRTPLDQAVDENDLALARYLLSRGAPVDARKLPTGKTPFLRTVEKSQLEMAQLLLEHGANLNALWSDDSNALYLAARESSPGMLKFLLDKGMDPNQTNSRGWTPLNNVRWREDGKLEATRLLVDGGADINAVHYNPVLIDAIRDQDLAWVKGLLALGADPQVKSVINQSALELARETGNPQLIQIVEKGLLQSN